MKRIFASLVAVFLAGPVAAQELGSYVAYIGPQDLYNSNGARLAEPWQVLRQDRANYHRFGIRDRTDQGDPWFADGDSRADLERMLRQEGAIHAGSGPAIVAGGVSVYVTVYPGRIEAYVFP